MPTLSLVSVHYPSLASPGFSFPGYHTCHASPANSCIFFILIFFYSCSASRNLITKTSPFELLKGITSFPPLFLAFCFQIPPPKLVVNVAAVQWKTASCESLRSCISASRLVRPSLGLTPISPSTMLALPFPDPAIHIIILFVFLLLVMSFPLLAILACQAKAFYPL